MRYAWVVVIITAMLSMGLVVVNLGQYQELSRLQPLDMKQLMEAKLFTDRMANQQLFRASVENMNEESTKAAKDTEAKVNNLASEMEKKKTEHDTCQQEQKKMNDEVENQKKANSDTEATLKAEAEAWKKEIETLKQQLTDFSPVCKHVKPDPLADKLCGIERTEAPKPPEAPANPEAPKAPEAPANPEAPKAPEAPANPEAPKAPEAPANPEAPKAPEAPANPEAPKAPEAPANPEAPKAPEAPANPEAPKAPEAPANPEAPKAPEAPPPQ